MLAIVLIAAVEWLFAKTVINNLACRGLTVTNPVLFAAIFVPSCFLFYLVGAFYIFIRLALLTTFGFLSLFQFEHTIFSADWWPLAAAVVSLLRVCVRCSWDISYRGLQTTVQLLNNIQVPLSPDAAYATGCWGNPLVSEPSPHRMLLSMDCKCAEYPGNPDLRR